MKFKKSIIQELIEDVEEVQENYGGSYSSFEEDGPPTASINAKVKGPWLWVSGRADYEGATWDPSTDRARGDPYSAHVSRDWVGKRKTAPDSVSSYKELNEWSLFHTRYEQEYTDVGSWGVHKDRYVRDVSEEGIVKLNVVSNRRFQDVSPSSETADDTLDLSIFLSVSFEQLLEMLSGSNSLIREVAAKQLGQLQDSRAIDPHLIEAVDDESEYVRNYAIGALGSLGGAKAIKKLSELILESKYPPIPAIHALSMIGDSGIDSISPGLNSENEYVRIGVITVLQNIGGERPVSLLLAAIKDNMTEEKVNTLNRIILALGELKALEATDDIVPFLEHEDYSVQGVVVDALRKMKSERAIDSLVRGIQTCHHWVRKKIVETLDEMGWKPSSHEEECWKLFANEEWEKLIMLGESATEIILRALTDDDQYHRGKILEPLIKGGAVFSDQRIADAIISIYKDEEQPSYRKRYALEALVCVPSAKNASFLIREHSKVKDSFIRDRIIDALKNLVMSNIDISSVIVSQLKRKNLESLSNKEIGSYLELFKIIPFTLEQLENIRPWIITIEKKKLKGESKQILSELLSLESIIPSINDDELSVRKKAMKALSEISIPSAIYTLVEALKDEHYYIREQVPKIIGNLGEGAVSVTISALKDKDYRVRIGAAEALGRLRHKMSAEPLISALEDEHLIVRQNAAWALGRLYIGSSQSMKIRERVVKALTKSMRTDHYLPVCFNAVYSLGQLDDPKTVKPLLEAMDHPKMEFRLNATCGFIKLSQVVTRDSGDGKLIIERLINALSDDAAQVRYNAVDGLRLFGGEKALEAVKKVYVDDDPELKKIVEDAIREIGSMLKRKRSVWSYTERSHIQLRDPEVIEELIPLFMDESEDNQRSTQIAIGSFGAMAYDRMIELLKDKEQHYLIRMGAAATLAEIGDKRATDILIDTLNDEHDDVRCNAAWALAELKDKSAQKALIEATRDSNWQVRLNAGAALGKIMGRGALDAVIRLSEDEHPEVRLVCTSYLGYFKSPKAISTLKARLNDDDKRVRKMAQDWIDYLEKKKK